MWLKNSPTLSRNIFPNLSDLLFQFHNLVGNLMEMDNNQQDKERINGQTCGCSFLDLVIFELTAAIFSQN